MQTTQLNLWSGQMQTSQLNFVPPFDKFDKINTNSYRRSLAEIPDYSSPPWTQQLLPQELKTSAPTPSGEALQKSQNQNRPLQDPGTTPPVWPPAGEALRKFQTPPSHQGPRATTSTHSSTRKWSSLFTLMALTQTILAQSDRPSGHTNTLKVSDSSNFRDVLTPNWPESTLTTGENDLKALLVNPDGTSGPLQLWPKQPFLPHFKPLNPTTSAEEVQHPLPLKLNSYQPTNFDTLGQQPALSSPNPATASSAPNPRSGHKSHHLPDDELPGPVSSLSDLPSPPGTTYPRLDNLEPQQNQWFDPNTSSQNTYSTQNHLLDTLTQTCSGPSAPTSEVLETLTLQNYDLPWLADEVPTPNNTPQLNSDPSSETVLSAPKTPPEDKLLLPEAPATPTTSAEHSEHPLGLLQRQPTCPEAQPSFQKLIPKILVLESKSPRSTSGTGVFLNEETFAQQTPLPKRQFALGKHSGERIEANGTAQPLLQNSEVGVYPATSHTRPRTEKSAKRSPGSPETIDGLLPELRPSSTSLFEPNCVFGHYLKSSSYPKRLKTVIRSTYSSLLPGTAPDPESVLVKSGCGARIDFPFVFPGWQCSPEARTTLKNVKSAQNRPPASQTTLFGQILHCSTWETALNGQDVPHYRCHFANHYQIDSPSGPPERSTSGGSGTALQVCSMTFIDAADTTIGQIANFTTWPLYGQDVPHFRCHFANHPRINSPSGPPERSTSGGSGNNLKPPSKSFAEPTTTHLVQSTCFPTVPLYSPSVPLSGSNSSIPALITSPAPLPASPTSGTSRTSLQLQPMTLSNPPLPLVVPTGDVAKSPNEASMGPGELNFSVDPSLLYKPSVPPTSRPPTDAGTTLKELLSETLGLTNPGALPLAHFKNVNNTATTSLGSCTSPPPSPLPAVHPFLIDTLTSPASVRLDTYLAAFHNTFDPTLTSPDPFDYPHSLASYFQTI